MAERKTKKVAAKKAAPKKKKVAAKKAAPKKKKAVAKKASRKMPFKFMDKDFKNITLVEMNAGEMAVICNALERSSVPGAKKLFNAFKAQMK